ncbi:hypothetical protein [Dietzia sp. CH92]|uniref:hypothetical protein n=1 Tax=Dietzia sp. CH92 TaxID=3051823 RepID=UPI0028D8A3A4|nr:hypothetical protein [Dietzia sp. CH92]
MTRHILWTSGWDSTFCVVSALLDSDDLVQPWYVLDSDRRSSSIELKRMGELSEMIARDYPHAAERLLPVTVVRVGEIPRDRLVEEQYFALHSEYGIGGQYDWLARLAKWKNLKLELSVLHGAGASGAFSEYLKPAMSGRYKMAAPEDSPLELYERFLFPLYGRSKIDMADEARQRGFETIMNHTWFCFNPISGRPCGYCTPCRQAIEEGLGYRVPTRTRRRRVQAWAFMLPTRIRVKLRQLSR